MEISEIETRPSIAIYLPWPATCLSPNWRGHWATRHKARKQQRVMACYLIREEKGGGLYGWDRAWVMIDAFPPDRRRRDADNLVASLKAAFDGAQDAGLIRDDHGLHHRPVQFHDPARENPGVWLTFYPVEEGDEI